MKKKPEGAAVQEGEDDFTTYKAAGKVGPCPSGSTVIQAK
jgi:hypothetical protein